MRIDSSRDRDKKKKKKKQPSIEAEILAIIEKSLKATLDVAMEDIFKDWNKKRR